jgi:hypothetical protein
MKCLGCDRPMSLWETLRDIFRPRMNSAHRSIFS